MQRKDIVSDFSALKFLAEQLERQTGYLRRISDQLGTIVILLAMILGVCLSAAVFK